MTVSLKLDRLSGSDEAAAFADAVRRGDNLEFGREGYTASGGEKEAGPDRALGAERFTASGDSKQVAGSRPGLAGKDFTASGDAKPPQMGRRISGDDFTASGDGKVPLPTQTCGD